MPDPPLPPPPRPRNTFAIVTAAFAAILILSLGMCGYTMGHSSFNNMPTSAVVELFGIIGSFVGLIILAIIAIIRAIRRS